MRRSNNALLVLFWIANLVILSSCGGFIRSYIAKDDTNTPSDFGADKSTVLVVKWKKAYDKEVENDFKKYYKGDYIMATPDEIKTTYTDVNKYRYIFGGDLFITTWQSTSPGAVGQSSGSLMGKLTDRLNKKSYESGVSSGASWKAVVQAYIQKMEKVRAKNQGQ
jgi:hypothetical protein